MPVPSAHYVVVMPVYEDWASVRPLLADLATALHRRGARAAVVLVNDCSPSAPPRDLVGADADAIASVDVVHLTRNVGHQRAIAVGLCQVAQGMDGAGVAVMDADGQDRATDLVRLLDAFEEDAGDAVVFAERVKRSEGLAFSVFYRLYRVMHHALTGVRVRVGNFSIVPMRHLQRLTTSSELWNHFAACVYHSRLPTRLVPIERGQRLVGRSQMNFTGLVSHGLGAMAVFADRIGVRLLLGTLVVGVLLVLALAATVAIRLFTDMAIPGWATGAAGALLILLVQVSLLALVFSFMVQHNRSGSGFIPARDWRIFVRTVERLHPGDA